MIPADDIADNCGKTIPAISPECNTPVANDRPNPQIAGGMFAIHVGRYGLARRMRMIIAQNLRPSAPRGAMRGKQRGRVYLEMTRAFGGDIGGGNGGLYPQSAI